MPTIIAIEHSWLEYASWIAAVFVALTAGAAAVFARSQLNEMSNFREQRLRILNATLLMELDKRWDSTEMSAARILWSKTRDEVEMIVVGRFPLANDGEKIQRVKDEWKRMLADKRVNSYADYVSLIGICGFFETVGLMVKRNYIHPADVLDLLRQPIVNVERCFRGHIEERQKEMGMPKGLFEHALYLGELAARENGDG